MVLCRNKPQQMLADARISTVRCRTGNRCYFRY